MNLLLSYVATHLLSLLEQELISAEPQIVDMIVKEMQLLISKVESFISGKSSVAAAIANPVLNEMQTVAGAAVNAAGQAVEATAQAQQNS